MNVVIYARYSSHSQTEQSIEGQLHTCYEYAKNNGYLVVGEYIDRAQSGTTDSRAQFQRMIADSDKHTFEGVLVYQLDRFARNRYDSAINKAKLKKNGVRVISARENISDDASGILVEGVLESMAEYYSAELSQKIRRGMEINAQKCLANGSNPGLGYKVDSERRYYVDEEEAKIVREIFERYASGETVADIIRDLNRRKLTTSLGKPFNKNSVHRILNNRRYIGYYLYKGQETPGGMPRIIEDELFERVHYILDRNKKAPARARGREEYLLTTKLFCGYCREMMTGYGGTGKSGKTYHYYACNNFKRRKCKKKVISKEKIEDRVVLECRKLLTDSNIERIAASVSEVCESNQDTASIKRIKAAIQEADTAIENLWKALERGQAADMITERIEKRQHEKEELQAQLAVEMAKQVTLTAPQVRAYLYSLRQGDKNDENIKRGIINIFLRAIYLYDDRFTLILNGSDTPITIDDILLDEIEEGLEGDLTNCEGCSSLVADAPPKRKDIRKDVLSFWIPPPRGRRHPSVFECSGSAKPPLRNSPPPLAAPNLRRISAAGPEGPLDGISVHSPKAENIDFNRHFHVVAKFVLRPRLFLPPAKRRHPPAPCVRFFQIEAVYQREYTIATSRQNRQQLRSRWTLILDTALRAAFCAVGNARRST